MTGDERSRLDDVADWYETEGFYAKILRRGYQVIQQSFVGEHCLELGCADGAMTEHLMEDFETVVAIDGAEEYCSEVRTRLDSENLTVKCYLFEKYRPGRQFDTIVMAHILEHIREPIELLSRARTWLSEGGRISIIVPNGLSLHRQVGVEMGVISTPTEIDDHDEKLGHRRVYTPDQLHRQIRDAGLEIRDSGGIALKPLTNDQMDEFLSEEIQRAYLQMGCQFPEIAAERYAVVCPTYSA